MKCLRGYWEVMIVYGVRYIDWIVHVELIGTRYVVSLVVCTCRAYWGQIRYCLTSVCLLDSGASKYVQLILDSLTCLLSLWYALSYFSAFHMQYIISYWHPLQVLTDRWTSLLSSVVELHQIGQLHFFRSYQIRRFVSILLCSVNG